MHHINLRHLFALPVIADMGSLSAAAERLNLSQSALTQALRKIERATATPLFARAGFGVDQTDAGRLFVKRSRRALALLRKAEREIGQPGSVAASQNPFGRRMTASQLRSFIAIVDTGGYSLAARSLSLAQPTVHRAAKEIEAHFGIEFFHRSAKGVDASDSARQLARYAELAFAEIRQGFEAVREFQGNMSSRISIGSLPLARAELLPAAVNELLDRYPGANVSILDGPYIEQLHALRNGRIDWIFGALRHPAPTADVTQQHLFAEPLAVVVRTGHPLLAAKVPDAATLAQLEWIVPRKNTPTRDLFAAFFEHAGIAPPDKIIECSSLLATRGLLQASDRATLLSPMQVRRDVEVGHLALLGTPLAGTKRSIGVTVRVEWEPTVVQAEFSKIVRVLSSQQWLSANRA